MFNRGLAFIGLLLVPLLRGPASAREGSPGSAGEDPAPTDRYDYERYSRLAGPLTEAPPGKPYRVRFRRLDRAHPVRSSLLVFAALMFVGGFLVWLMLPTHWPTATEEGVVFAGSIVMTATTAIIGCFAFVNVATLCRATMLARDPVPVHPESGRRVAFITTIVPSAEPPELVRPTLEAALQIDYDGPLDVWLLDEGDDDAVKQMCAELGVHHFTRRGIERWNQRAGAFKAKTKHGNYNAWLDAHADRYDFFLGVDPDHVPVPSFAERFLGYFRDPDVAFVVGPQVYGNYDGFIVRSAESQQFLFHSLLQRAGNRSRTPMLVGTNNAVRIEALVVVPLSLAVAALAMLIASRTIARDRDRMWVRMSGRAAAPVDRGSSTGT